MGSHPSCIVPLAEAARAGDGLVGGKAARLGSLVRAGLSVPRGFCITTAACEQFIAEAALSSHIAMELGRRPLHAMRWSFAGLHESIVGVQATGVMTHQRVPLRSR